MNIKDLKLGTKLELEIYNDDNEKITPSFASKLEGVPEENIAIVSAPIFEGNLYPVHIDWLMNVYFLHGGDLYYFPAKVLGRETDGHLAYLKLEILGKTEKIQRREFFRFECSIPVRYRVLAYQSETNGEEVPMNEGVTRDLSGGGMCIKLNEELKVNDLLEIEFELEQAKKRNIHVTGKVVRFSRRHEDPKYGYEAAVVFKKIRNTDKEAIVRFIFEEQRKLRSKGLI